MIDLHAYRAKIRFFLLALVAAGLAFPMGQTRAVEVTQATERIVEGHDAMSGVRFSARVRDNALQVRITTRNKKIVVFYQSSPRTIFVRGRYLDSDEQVFLNLDETDMLGAVLSQLAGLDSSRLQSGDGLIRALNLLEDWPPGLPLDVFFNESAIFTPDATYPLVPRPESGVADRSACSVPPPIGLSESLCSEINLVHQGDYIIFGREIFELPFPPHIPLFLPLLCRNFSEVAGPIPSQSGGCFGRCGRSCIGDGPPNNRLNIYTQSCFDHDGCVEARGLLDDFCNQMFLYSVKDFLSGVDCGPL